MINPRGKQAEQILEKFLLTYIYQHGKPIEGSEKLSVSEQQLEDAAYKMMQDHELCFMQKGECEKLIIPGGEEIIKKLGITTHEFNEQVKDLIDSGAMKLHPKDNNIEIIKDKLMEFASKKGIGKNN